VNDSESVLTAADKLNLETGRLGWPELQRHFARGVVVVVDEALDLIDIAAAFVDDDSDRVENLMARRQVWKADTADADCWNREGAEFWAVVAAPWVLVQRTRG